MASNEMEEELRRYEEAGRTHRRHLTDAALQVPIKALPQAEPLVLPAEATVRDALRLMQQHRRGAVLAVQGGRVAGIFTERDVLLKVAGRDVDPARARLRDHMTPDPVVLHANDPIGLALNKMSIGGYRHIPIVDGAGAPVGMLELPEVGRFLAEFFPEAAVNVPPDARVIADETHGG